MALAFGVHADAWPGPVITLAFGVTLTLGPIGVTRVLAGLPRLVAWIGIELLY
jgi:hypothetical protein